MKTQPSKSQQDFDERMMRRAIQLARRGEGRVEPNPMVGCVIVRRAKFMGEGFHKRFGGPHAEIVAMRSCETSPRGATVYVTLEPCCHEGKTPPCVDALIQAKVARIVVGARDPNPLVAGRGLRRLRRAGIRVALGVARHDAVELLAPFATVHTLRRPFVIAKWAEGLDGRLVTPRGESPWISCKTSQKLVHRLRARVDAILVGIETVRADDPILTARGVPIRRIATRIVLDSRLRISTKARLVRTARQVPTLVFTTTQRAGSRKRKTLADMGVEVVGVRERKGGLSVTSIMSILAKRGMTNVLVEGGPTVLNSFLKKKIVDEAFVFVAPRLVGAKFGLGTTEDAGCIRAKVSPLSVDVARSGTDLRYHWRLTSTQRGRPCGVPSPLLLTP